MPNLPTLSKQKKAPLGEIFLKWQVATSMGFYTMRSKENMNDSYTSHLKTIKMWEII
jgi:hypothetical protein